MAARDEVFEVIGAGGAIYEVTGEEILGAILGDDDDYIDGDDDDDIDGDDDDFEVGRRGRRRRRRRARRRGVPVKRAGWRKRQLAPGVQAPDQGMYPLGLTPSNGTGIFAAGISEIQYTGQLQKPFRGERVMARVVRTGATATGTLLAQLFVGTDLQQASIRGINIENIGDVQGFGVRLTMVPAQPGVVLTFVVRPTLVPTAPDTISLDMEVLGRIVA